MVWAGPVRGKRARRAVGLYGLRLTHYTDLMKHSSLGLSALVCAGWLMMGCGSSSGSGATACSGGQVDCDGTCIDPIAATLEAIQSEIFEVRGCASSSCHDDTQPAALLDLSSVSASADNLIEVASIQIPEILRVAEGSSSESYLMNKILGVGMANGTARMPQNDDGITLCQPEIDAIRQWIDDGAAAP